MKLGILVVYLFDESLESLLDLHLQNIRKYTDVPYTIYGSIGRLNDRGRLKLSEYPEVRRCEIPPTDLRSLHEHAYYLDHLARIAIEDGVTHVVAMHLDSFPIVSGWAEKLKALTDETGSCVVLDLSYTACLFFSRDFYLKYYPTFRDTDRLDFIKKYQLINHSGVSFLQICHDNGLPWHVLGKNTSRSKESFADLFGGMIFHLRGAVWGHSESEPLKRCYVKKRWMIRVLNFVVWSLSTHRVRIWIWNHMPNSFLHAFGRWLRAERGVVLLAELQATQRQLLENPEKYLSKLRQVRCFGDKKSILRAE